MKKKQIMVGLSTEMIVWVEAEAKKLACPVAQILRTLVAAEMERRKS